MRRGAVATLAGLVFAQACVPRDDYTGVPGQTTAATLALATPAGGTIEDDWGHRIHVDEMTDAEVHGPTNIPDLTLGKLAEVCLAHQPGCPLDDSREKLLVWREHSAPNWTAIKLGGAAAVSVGAIVACGVYCTSEEKVDVAAVAFSSVVVTALLIWLIVRSSSGIPGK